MGFGLKSLFGSIHKNVKKVAGGANKAVGGAVKGVARSVNKVMPPGIKKKKPGMLAAAASKGGSMSGANHMSKKRNAEV